MMSASTETECSDVEVARPASTWRRTAGILGAVALVGCVVCLVSLQTADREISAREFLEGRELADVVGDQYVAASKGQLHEHRAAVKEQVQAGFSGVCKEIDEDSPNSARQLEAIPLSRGQQKSLLTLMTYMNDYRVQSIGHDITDAVSETTAEGGDSDKLKSRITEKLAPRMKEMRQLASELYPQHLVADSLNTDNMEIVQAFKKWQGAKVVHAKTNTQSSSLRRLREEDVQVGRMHENAAVIMSHLQMMHPEFEQPPLRRLQASTSVSECLSEAMQLYSLTAAMSCMSSSFSSAMSSVKAMLGFDTSTGMPINPSDPAGGLPTATPTQPEGWR